jgi:hypothetical protein
MTDELTLAAWLERLKERGYPVHEPDWGTMPRIVVCPHEDIGVTPEQVFRMTGCPEPHRSRWLWLVSRQPPGYYQDFMAGPGSWLLSRLARSRRVVAWSDRGLPWDGLDAPLHREWGMDVPSEAAPFFAPTAGPESTGPRLLSVEDGFFADAVAACILFASVGLRDCYLADTDGTEVYLAHHHDQVEVFVPDAGKAERLLGEMEGMGRLFDMSLSSPSMGDAMGGD